jgi:hypothetical protein
METNNEIQKDISYKEATEEPIRLPQIISLVGIAAIVIGGLAMSITNVFNDNNDNKMTPLMSVILYSTLVTSVICFLISCLLEKRSDKFRQSQERQGIINWPCPDCKTIPGHLHALYCTREICPFCNEQLVLCDCMIGVLGLDSEEQKIVERFIDNQVDPLKSIMLRWELALEEKGRIVWPEGYEKHQLKESDAN